MNRYVVVLLGVLGMLQAAPAHADIAVAIAGPMSGSEATFGEQFRRGAEKAVADINASGGVLGQKLSLVISDDACDPRQAVSSANDLMGRNVAAVIGHFCSGASIPASDVYLDANVVQISPASTNPTFTERGLANVFRMCGRDDAQGPAAVNYVLSHFPNARIAIVNDRSPYGKGLADQFQKSLNQKGVHDVMNEAIAAGEQNYSALVSKLKAVKADILYFGGYQTEGGLIVRQMRDQGLKTILVGGDGLVSEEFWTITGTAGEGTLMTFGPDPRLNPANAALVAWYRAQHYEPEAYTLYTYAAFQTWAQAVKTAGTTDTAKVEAALHSGHFDTVMGSVSFDSKGDNTAPGYVLYLWKNGQYSYAP